MDEDNPNVTSPDDAGYPDDSESDLNVAVADAEPICVPF